MAAPTHSTGQECDFLEERNPSKQLAAQRLAGAGEREVGKSGTWVVQPSGDTNSSYLRFPTFFTGIFITLPHSSHFLPIYEKKATFR